MADTGLAVEVVEVGTNSIAADSSGGTARAALGRSLADTGAVEDAVKSGNSRVHVLAGRE